MESRIVGLLNDTIDALSRLDYHRLQELQSRAELIRGSLHDVNVSSIHNAQDALKILIEQTERNLDVIRRSQNLNEEASWVR